jgi:hypothetical protein
MISVDLCSPRSIFVTVATACCRLFVDIDNSLYCSQQITNLIVKKAAGDAANASRIVAGHGSCGPASNMLCALIGIFVDTHLNMYIADSGNDRVQLCKMEELIGTTVSSALNNPTDVILDAKSCLFVADSNNHRIIRSGPCGFLCLTGCVNADGWTPNELHSPLAIAFDSRGNILVADETNRRIQKFTLTNNSCDEVTVHM